MKLIAVLSFVAICLAQTPPRPKVAEMFVMTGDAEIKINGSNSTRYGQVIVAQNNDNMQVLFDLTLNGGQEENKTIALFKQERQYSLIFREGTFVNCSTTKISRKYYPFFLWVDYAKYTGNRTVQSVVYDFWALNIKGFFGELGVEQSNPNVPKFFNYNSLTNPDYADDVRMIISTFSATPPPSSYFTVPKECM